MANSVASKSYFTFVGGLNTEGGPLTFPANTWQDGDNIIPDTDGSLTKRTAVNYEGSFAFSTTASSATSSRYGAFHAEEWPSVAGDGARNFVVVQQGIFPRSNLLSFYDNTGSNVSATEKSSTIDLYDYQLPTNPSMGFVAPISCAPAMGKLLVCTSDTKPVLLSYDADTDTISAADITLQIRDLLGLDDNLAVDQLPSTITQKHKYNLLNQGWTQGKFNNYQTITGVYPSNAQIWTAGKNSTDDFDAALLDKQDFGTTPAPKGRFVLDVLRRDRSTASGIPLIDEELEPYGPTTCAFYAGRAWYAGFKSDTIGTWVLFSQVADTADKFGKCYQDADPTSEFISDLVDTDGGVIPIQDAGSITKLVPVDQGILVLASNGVWLIRGGLETGFSATNYEVKKLSSTPCEGADATVAAEGAVYFWSNDGIWVVKSDQFGALSVANLTDRTIRTFYLESIPAEARDWARGVYNQEGKTIYWAFNSEPDDVFDFNRFKKDRLLCLDLRLGAFYTMTVEALAANSPVIQDIFVTRTLAVVESDYTVIDGSENTVVTAGGTNTVVAELSVAGRSNSKVKFLVEDPAQSYKHTFAEFEPGLVAASRYKDWYAANTAGVSFDTYLVTGYEHAGGDKLFQTMYVTVYMRRTETGVDSSGNPINESSCMLQGRWDWTDHSNAGKWSTEQEVYRHRRVFEHSVPASTFADGYPVVVTKNKLRGRGRALHLKFTGSATKDMQLLGWSVPFVANENV